jgi:hypothetical protein
LRNCCLGQNKGNHGRNGLTDPIILRHFVSPVGSSSIVMLSMEDAGDFALRTIGPRAGAKDI